MVTGTEYEVWWSLDGIYHLISDRIPTLEIAENQKKNLDIMDKISPGNEGVTNHIFRVTREEVK